MLKRKKKKKRKHNIRGQLGVVGVGMGMGGGVQEAGSCVKSQCSVMGRGVLSNQMIFY